MSEQETPTNRFVPLSVLVEAIMAQDKATFLEKHPESLLVIDNPGDDAENASFQTVDVGGKSSSDGGRREKLIKKLSGAGSCVYVLKREPNKFASMVTVGRAANNGMRINVVSVSKFHAYFTHVARDKCWYLADAHSSNGTFIDGKELPPSHGKHPLANGSILRFGPDVTAQYFEAEGVWEMLNDAGTPGEADKETIAVTAEDVGILRNGLREKYEKYEESEKRKALEALESETAVDEDSAGA